MEDLVKEAVRLLDERFDVNFDEEEKTLNSITIPDGLEKELSDIVKLCLNLESMSNTKTGPIADAVSVVKPRMNAFARFMERYDELSRYVNYNSDVIDVIERIDEDLRNKEDC